ncbi:hypothetical protein ACO2Q8_17700 [Larkinella sp. VNQ87]|uniref:hypothetical protein n=1 Tax=Larkinella sp. VNQ87 TaxID=3400921 RepID=UPI003C129A8A
MENQNKGASTDDAPKPDTRSRQPGPNDQSDIPPLSEADTAPMYTDLGVGGVEDPYNKGEDEAMDTLLYTDTHTAINTTENRSNSIAYEGENDDLTLEIDPEDL